MNAAAIAMLLAGASPSPGEVLPAAPDISSTSAVAVPPVVPEPAVPTASPPLAAPPVQAQELATDEDEIVVTGNEHVVPGDPLGDVNAVSFQAVQTVDKAIVGPIALGYKNDLPSPVRKGIHNFLNNLDEPVVFINFLLQLKPGKAAETLARFAINSTVGVGGLIDVAKKPPFKLPRRPNGFAYTLGYYGVKPGPYLFLPLIGSTTVRDVFGRALDLLVLPTAIGKPFSSPIYGPLSGVVSSIDDRAEYDDELKKLRDENPDPYGAVRNHYLQRRQAQIDILRGKRISVEDPTPPPAKQKKQKK
jgi:phospholipid-binding lipoprotein MlaA